MIFVTLGSQKFQFNRLLIEIDNLVKHKKIKEEIFAQIGYSDYKPVNYKYKDFIDRNMFKNMINSSDIVITHAGTGSIITALKMNKKVIAVARLKEYGEHIDNHQLDILEQFKQANFIYSLSDIKELEKAVNEIKGMNFNYFKSNTNNFIDILEKFIDKN